MEWLRGRGLGSERRGADAARGGHGKRGRYP
jgi:hypothetical protein